MHLILVVNCTDPINGRSDVETVGWDGSLSWQTTLTVKCSTFGKEFWVNGSSWSADLTLTCGMDKKWTPSLPKCEWRHCFDPPQPTPDLFLTQVSVYFFGLLFPNLKIFAQRKHPMILRILQHIMKKLSTPVIPLPLEKGFHIVTTYIPHGEGLTWS